MDAQAIDEAREPTVGDLLYGVKAIADYLGIDEPAARYRCETGQIPTFKMGIIICAKRSTLARWLDEIEDGHAAA